MSVNNSSAVRKPGEAAALGLPSTPSSGSVSHSSMTGPRRWASKLHTAWVAAGQGAAEHRRDGLGRPYSPQPCLQGSPGAHRRGSSHGQTESKGHGGCPQPGHRAVLSPAQPSVAAVLLLTI